MLTIPLYVGWELARTKNATSINNPMFRYTPTGAKEGHVEVYRLSIFQMSPNSYKFVPVVDGYVAYTGPGGDPIKSSMSYEGFKQILAVNPYIVLLSKQAQGGKFKGFAAFMVPDITDERRLKVESLRYLKEINVAGTKHRTTRADTQRQRLYDWEDLAYSYTPQGPYAPTAAKRAFDAKNAAYMLKGEPTGTKARYAELTKQVELSRDDAKRLIRAVATAYGVDVASLKVRFQKPVAKGNKVTLGVAHGDFEDIYDTQGIRQLAITLMGTAPHVILHEMAHIVSYTAYSRAVGGAHGPEFAGVFAHILDAFCPWTAPGRAAAFMQANGLKVVPYDPAAARTAAPRRLGSHRDFEQAHAIEVRPDQNRRVHAPWVNSMRLAG